MQKRMTCLIILTVLAVGLPILTCPMQITKANGSHKSPDLNGDGIVDIIDIYAVGKEYGSWPGQPNWKPECDVNEDNVIDTTDLYAIAQHWGERI